MNSDKRLQIRSLCADLVKLEWTDEEPDGKQTVPAVLEDISPRGACLQVEIPIPAGIETEIQHGDGWAMRGRTTYCVFREIGYFVGVEFVSGAGWSSTAFSPQHLLDLEELLAAKVS